MKPQTESQRLARAGKEVVEWFAAAFDLDFTMPYPVDDPRERKILTSKRIRAYWPDRQLHRLWLFYLRDDGYNRKGGGHSIALFSRDLAGVISGYSLAKRDLGGEEPIPDELLAEVDRHVRTGR